jgi:hypothetical protein
MSNAVTITTDVVSYRAQVEKLAKLTGRGLRDVMREMVSIMSGQLARRFPPSSAKVGKQAIHNDLTKIVYMEWSPEAIDGLSKRTGDPRFDATGSLLREWHESHRTKPHRRTASIRSRSKIGGAEFSDKLYVPRNVVNAYAKERALQVGKLKAAWTKATTIWKGAKAPASWVSRHPDKGTVDDKMKDNGDGSIEFTNTVKEASFWTDINNFVLKSQTRMLQHKIRYELKKQKQAFNSKRAA